MSRNIQKIDTLLVAAGIIYPAAFTYFFYFVEGFSHPAFFLLAKVLQFSFPFIWVCLVLKRPLAFGKCTKKDLVYGAISGLIILGSFLLFYLVGLSKMDVMPFLQASAQERVAMIGVHTKLLYVTFSLLYMTVHAFLEEYYWRWFMFQRLYEKTSYVPALLISAVGFMAHHVLVIGVLVGFATAVTYVFSFFVCVGGVFWAWMFHRFKSIYGAWVSHVFVDASLFIIGYHILF